jgi:glycosyltransferase involved in cell wall biosynthesis
LPTIATDLEGIRDVVRDGESGVLVQAEDASAFESAVRSVLDSGPRWTALAQGAQARAEELDWSNVIEKYLDVLSQRRVAA